MRPDPNEALCCPECGSTVRHVQLLVRGHLTARSTWCQNHWHNEPQQREDEDMPINRRVYSRDQGNLLLYRGTAMSQSPESAAEQIAKVPGKYVVMDLDFTEVTQVTITLNAAVA